MEGVDHIDIVQVSSRSLVSEVYRMLQREVPDREGLVFRIAGADAALEIMVELGQAGRHLTAAGTRSGLLEIEGDRFEYEMNVLLELTRNNIRIAQVPIRTIYENDNSGSHFHALKDSMRIYIGIFKFMAASFFCFLLDLFCFSVLNFVTNGRYLTHCNVIARLISATVNFTINKHLVFKDDQSVIKTALKYIVVAAIVLTLNSVLLNLLVKGVRLNAIVSKIIVECTMFFFSWATQQFLIFNRSFVEGRAVR